MATLEHAHPVQPEELMDFADDELSAARAGVVESHIAQCAACRQALAELRDVSSSLSRWTVDDAPAMRAPFTSGPRHDIRRRLLSARRQRVWQLAAAAVIVAGLTALWFGGTRVLQETAPTRAAFDREDSGAEKSGTLGVGVGGPAAGRESGARPSTAAQSLQAAAPAETSQGAGTETPRKPQVIRTATLTIVVNDVDAARSAIDRTVRAVGGFVGDIQASGGRGEIRVIRATLRVPAARMDQALETLRALGHVDDESQHGEDVMDQIVDLDARLSNARNTEKRLMEVLRNRTGDLADVLAVEREIARVREDIERLDAQRKNLEQRVSFATVTLTVSGERQAQFDAAGLPFHRQLRNAFVDGIQDAYGSALALATAVLRLSPVLLLWTVVLWWPARRAYRAWRAAAVPATSAS